jgi:FlgD Ig-like domain
VQRAVTLVLVPALLVATAAAFILTEALKLDRSPVKIATKGFQGATFSPVCHCPTDHARVLFRLRSRHRLSIEVQNAGGTVVRHLEPAHNASGLQHVVWNGRVDNGALAPQGSYWLRLSLNRSVFLSPTGRTIVLPDPMVLDTTPPRVRASVQNRSFSPDGDGRADRLEVAVRSNEQPYDPCRVLPAARVAACETGPQGGGMALEVRQGGVLVRTVVPFQTRKSFVLSWNGRINGRLAPVGDYAISVRVRDRAGNVTRVDLGTARLRFVDLAPVPVGRRRIVLHLSTDSRRVRFRLQRLGAAPAVVAAGRLPVSRSTAVVVSAPLTAGRYRVTVVTLSHHAASAVVRVRGP